MLSSILSTLSSETDSIITECSSDVPTIIELSPTLVYGPIKEFKILTLFPITTGPLILLSLILQFFPI